MNQLVKAAVQRPSLALLRSQIRAAAAGLVVVALCGCNKAPPEPPTQTVSPERAMPAPASASTADTSVPAAASVLAPAGASSADPSGGRSNKSMSRAQESTAMPMPGQNNDHSAPLSPAKPASGS
jgi:hypothetical protein